MGASDWNSMAQHPHTYDGFSTRVRRLRIAGFRSLKSVDWTPGALNVLIGANGSGKTNLLRALELLRDAAAGALRKHVDGLGGAVYLSWDRQAERVSFTLETPHPDADPGADNPREHRDYHLALAMLDGGRDYRVADERLDLYSEPPGESPSRSTPIDLLAAGPGTVGGAESLLGESAGLAQPHAAVRALRRELSGWSIHRGFRTDPNAPVFAPAQSRRETQLAPGGTNLVQVLHTRYSAAPAFKESLDDLLRAGFPGQAEELSFPPSTDGRIDLKVRCSGLQTPQGVQELPEGMLRFLFLCAALLDPEPRGVIAIDEPELGLHPRLLEITADLAAEAARHAQVILATHSVFLLDRLAAHGPSVTVTVPEAGETRLKTLDSAEMAEWLREYTLGEFASSGAGEALV